MYICKTKNIIKTVAKEIKYNLKNPLAKTTIRRNFSFTNLLTKLNWKQSNNR